MPIVKLPDGTLVRLPDEVKSPSAVLDETGETLKNVTGFAAETGRKAAASGLRTVDSLSETLSKLPTGVGLLSKVMRGLTGGLEPSAKKVDVPLHENASDAEKFFDAGIRGAGSAAVMPIPGAGVLGNIIPGVAGGLGSEAGGRYAEKLSPSLKGVGQFLGGALAGGGAGFALGPKQSVARQDIREALQGADFSAAQAKAARAAQVGSTTNTAAEAFPPNSAIMTLAEEARGGNTANALRTRTQDRPQDLQNLGTKFMDNIAPEVDANIVANSAGGSANALLENIRQLRGQGLGNRLQGETVPAHKVTGMYTDLYRLGEMQARSGAGDAYRKVAESLVGQDGKPITNVQQLSLAIKGLKDAAKNPNSPIFSGGQINGVDLSQAIKAAEGELGLLSPAFKEGMTDFRGFSQEVLTPARQGPLGSLADKNPLIAGQTPAGKLGGLLQGNSPKVVQRTARQLADPLMTGGNPTAGLDIARALAQQKLGKGQTDPGQALRGSAGSPAEAQFDALLRAGGKNPSQVRAPLDVADALQAFKGLPGRNELPHMGFAQLLIRPFRTLDMLMTGKSQKAVSAEVAKLLADPGNIPELQKIAMFDPGIREALSARGLMLPAFNNQEK